MLVYWLGGPAAVGIRLLLIAVLIQRVGTSKKLDSDFLENFSPCRDLNPRPSRSGYLRQTYRWNVACSMCHCCCFSSLMWSLLLVFNVYGPVHVGFNCVPLFSFVVKWKPSFFFVLNVWAGHMDF